jgi:cell division protease FtsH
LDFYHEKNVRRSGGGGSGQIFGKSKAKLLMKKQIMKTTFKDVAGLEGAKKYRKLSVSEKS